MTTRRRTEKKSWWNREREESWLMAGLILDNSGTNTNSWFLWRVRKGCVHFEQCTQTQRDTDIIWTTHSHSKPHAGRRSFKLWYNYTLKASLRRYSSLAISSATQPGISGMATWMMYFRRIAKCCKPPRPQRDRLNTWLHQGTFKTTHTKNSSEVLCSLSNLV